MADEKRRHDRHQVRFKLVYDDGDGYHAGWVSDLSDAGLFLETEELLPIGSEVRLLSLDMDDAHHFELSARVERLEEDGDRSGMGLSLTELDEAQRLFLLRLIASLEEEASAFEGETDPYFGKSLPKRGFQRSPSGIWRPGPPPLPRSGSQREPHRAPSAAAESEEEDSEPPSAEPWTLTGDLFLPGGPDLLGPAGLPADPTPPVTVHETTDLAAAIEHLVGSLGQTYADTVLVDEHEVVPLLLEASLAAHISKPDPDPRPLDPDSFASPSESWTPLQDLARRGRGRARSVRPLRPEPARTEVSESSG